MPGEYSGNGGVGKVVGLIGQPVLSPDGLGALLRAAPGLDQLPLLEPADAGDGPDRVPLAFGVPGGDAGLQQGIAEREEHLGALVEAVAVAARHPLGE